LTDAVKKLPGPGNASQPPRPENPTKISRLEARSDPQSL
jgi:hypothetical protein